MVLTALSLRLTFHSGPILPTLSVSPQISWIGAVILMFSAIIPSTPTKTLLAGLVARQIAKAREMGSYQLGELFGRDGMGEVYKASHIPRVRGSRDELVYVSHAVPGRQIFCQRSSLARAVSS
jgi:hypothetical protein